MKKSFLVLAIFTSLVYAKTTQELLDKTKDVCNADIAIIASMDVNTKEYTYINSTYPQLQQSQEIRESMRKDIEKITKRSLHEFGPILRPFVLAYMEKNNPEFTPTVQMLNTDDYHAFGDEVSKYISLDRLYEPFESFGFRGFAVKDTLDKEKVGNYGRRLYYTGVTNGYSAPVRVDELMHAYSEVFTNEKYPKTRDILLKNFEPEDRSIGGVEYRYWLHKVDKEVPAKKFVSKSLILYTDENEKEQITALILVNIKNRECRKENYLYDNFKDELIDVE